MAAAPRVFLSHATADAAFAERLSDNLRQLGADVWLDSSHLGAGDFVARINTALQDRDIFVLVLTPAAIQSQWVPQEMNTAIAREKQGFIRSIYVVMAQVCPPNTIPPLWTVYNRYDATRDYAGALYGVAERMGLSVPRPQKPVNPLPALKRTGRRAANPRLSVWAASVLFAAVVSVCLGALLEHNTLRDSTQFAQIINHVFEGLIVAVLFSSVAATTLVVTYLPRLPRHRLILLALLAALIAPYFWFFWFELDLPWSPYHILPIASLIPAGAFLLFAYFGPRTKPI